MAGNEGTSQTELFTGWSSVVHQPCEEPEESELPSTVDMAAFSTGLSIEPTATSQDNDSDSESESDSSNSSQSGSQSESSDSDSTGSSQESSSRSPTPEFSVTSSQTDCLRLTIATVKKPCASPVVEKVPITKPTTTTTAATTTVASKNEVTSSSESPCSTDSESESGSDASNKISVKNSAKDNHHPTPQKKLVKVRSKVPDKKDDKKVNKKENISPKAPPKSKSKAKRTKKMASLPLSRGSTGSSSDSEDSDADSAMLASCSLQEISQEELAAILPDQECDAFGGFECSRTDKNSPETGDLSGSDMELPQQAVNAIIQRTTESSSESESHAPPNPSSLFSNSLLQQFVAQTQMLSTPSSLINSSEQKDVTNSIGNNNNNSEVQSTVCNTESESVKRKRGRPKKSDIKVQSENKSSKNEYSADPNVSPDSGIQNSPDHVSSPEPNSTTNKSKSKEGLVKKSPLINDKKRIITDKIETVNSANRTKEISKLPVTSNRFDRLLYANTDRVLYPPRRKAGRPSITRKGPGRPPKHKPVNQNSQNNNNNNNKQQIEKPQKVCTEKTASSKSATVKTVEQKQQQHIKSGRKEKGHRKSSTKDLVNVQQTDEKNNDKLNGNKDIAVPKKSKSSLLYEICERVSKRLELNNKYTTKVHTNKEERHVKSNRNKNKHRRPALVVKNKMDMIKTKYTTLKNAKLMHSKHKHKKHKKCKFKILKPVTASADQKINVEIEKLIADFVKFCVISTQKTPKENLPEILKTLKKVTKKRKTIEHNERKKKKQNITTNLNKETNNEQRLPLKKRHYHMSTTNDNNKIETAAEITSQEVPVEITEDKTKLNVKQSTATITTKVDKQKTNIVPTIKNDPVKIGQTSPKHTPVIKPTNSCPKIQKINNNEYDSNKSVDCHIDEAIEACINKFSATKNIKPITEVKKETKPSTTITATTPKKRHRLEMALSNEPEISSPPIENKPPIIENQKIEELKEIKIKSKTPVENVVVSEVRIKRNLSPRIVIETQKKIDKKIESVAQIITRKKNRLEDLASNLVSKINPTVEIEKKKISTEETRASVIKYPTCKKAKPTELEKLDIITSSKPTGIFMPTVDLELMPNLICNNLIQTSNNKETLIPEPKTPEKSEEFKNRKSDNEKTTQQSHVIIPKSSPDSPKKKIRKRRAINRTGFPTVKKKKKKTVENNNFEAVLNNEDVPLIEQPIITCDRVPKEGEEYTKFVERTEKSDIIPLHHNLDEGGVSKWDAMSECDSLPQEERTDFDLDDIKSDIKPDRMTLRARDTSPTMSVDTKFSEKSKYDDLDDVTLENRIKCEFEKKRKRVGDKNVEQHLYPKRKIRDISPASSIEPHAERRLRDSRGSGSGDEAKKNKKAPKWRKKFLVAGLFSDYYKEDDETTRIKRRENAAKSRFTYNPQEHPYGLLPPPYHCGKYLRCRKLPFQIPYDLWWQHTHSQLPGRDLVPSWNYRKIRTNIYNIKTNVGACEPQSCNCNPTSNCGDDCINRLVLSECPAAHRCHNQKIQKHEWAPGIEKFMTESKGWGIRTKLPIKNGEFILEYVGEVVSDQEFKERMATIYVNDNHHYCLHLDGGLVIDGHRMGGDGRFVNHSCQPNCEMQKWSVNGQFRMALFALRDIESNEELTYDYNFSLFNAAEGQECLCGSVNCRGVIGGKSQRVRQLPLENNSKHQPGRVGRPRKNQAKKTNNTKEPPASLPPPPTIPTPQVKPISHQQKCFILEHHCFLLRNLSKVKKVRSITSVQVSRQQTTTPVDHGATFINHLNALQKPRNMKTRRLAQAEDDPELKKSVKLANILRDIWNTVTTAKDNGQLLCTPFMTLPSKRKVPEFYQRTKDPIDLNTIEQNIGTGIYRSPDSFDGDMVRLFSTYIKYYGRTSDLGISATRLKKIYTETKQQSLSKFEDVLGKKPPANFIFNKNKSEEEDIIRCICGMFRDEGLMIQCERCLCWQHNECVKADVSAASYHCERCVHRKVDYEIPMDEYTEHGHRYYMTLMRGDLQLRQGDTVYVLRDIPIPGTDRKHTYDTIGKVDYAELDIFRIERLWKDSKTGQRFAYGHHFLRPHETYHEPTRKFFVNEVMRVPLYEAVPVELIICHCWVVDLNTYCKGRPLGAPEEHIYICEYRVDKSARLFSKASKTKFPICTKTYAFERFSTRRKITRTYTPHDLDPTTVKPRGRKPQDCEEREIVQLPVHVPVVRTRTQQKTRLNKILLNLLSKMPSKQVLDVSYLLEGGRRRKKNK